jgi:outer membrane scaffolding protein for murein synthesis (MipA/OmpV family)
MTRASCLVLLASLVPVEVQAQRQTDSLGLGIAVVPDFDGSADFTLRPSIRGTLSFGSIGVELRGTSLRADVIDGPFGAGPIFNFRFGRGDDVKNAQVAALPEIDEALEVGAFLSVPLNRSFAISAEILGDVSDTHGGLLANASLDWRQEVSDRLDLFASASISVMDDAFAETYYGVTTQGSAASGFATFTPSGGLRDVGIQIGLGYDLTDRLSMNATIGIRRLQGDAADSPIVRVGDRQQGIVTLGLGYEF